METASHLQIVLRNRRGVFSVRRTDVRAQVWQLDVWRVQGKTVARRMSILTLSLQLDGFCSVLQDKNCWLQDFVSVIFLYVLILFELLLFIAYINVMRMLKYLRLLLIRTFEKCTSRSVLSKAFFKLFNAKRKKRFSTVSKHFNFQTTVKRYPSRQRSVYFLFRLACSYLERAGIYFWYLTRRGFWKSVLVIESILLFGKSIFLIWL